MDSSRSGSSQENNGHIQHPYFTFLGSLLPEAERESYLGSQTKPVASSTSAPYLEITEQPQDKFRYRYVSELHGTHGCIMGKNKSKIKKTFPAVRLMNYNKEAFVRCTIYTQDHKLPHPHVLVQKLKCGDKYEPHDVKVSKTSGYEVVFMSIGILQTARKNLVDVLVEKIMDRTKENQGRAARVSKKLKSDIVQRVQKETKSINLNGVCLCFEAFTKDDKGAIQLLCNPVFSDPVYNMKSAQTNELKICRMDRFYGSCKGDNIKIRFFETDDEDNDVWQAYGIFSELDVHHQFAIAFKTPPYKPYETLMENKKVFLELLRPSDNLRSDPQPFTYKPLECNIYRSLKRPRMETVPTSTWDANEPSSSTSTYNGQPSNMMECPTQSYTYNLQPEAMRTTGPPNDFFGGIQINAADTTQFDEIIAELLTRVNNNLANKKKDLPSKDIPKKLSIKATRKANAALKAAAAKKNKFSPREVVEQEMGKLVHKTIESVRKAERSKCADNDVGTILRSSMCLRSSNLSALHTAVRCNQLEEMKILLGYLKKYIRPEQYETTIDAQNELKETPLYLCVLNGHPEMLKALLEAGADATLDCNGKTPLQLALEPGNMTCFKILVQHFKETSPLKLNEVCEVRPQSLLYEAVNLENLEAVELLIDAGVNTNIGDMNSLSTPLHRAVEKKNFRLVQILLRSSQTQIDAPDVKGNTALHLACVVGGTGSTELTQLLIDAGADPWKENYETFPEKALPEKEMARISLDSASDSEDGADGNLHIKEEIPSDDEQTVEQRGQTAFDLAVNKPALMDEEEMWEDACSDQPLNTNLTEASIPTECIADALDSKTLVEISAILEKDGSWKELATELGLEEQIPGQITTEDLRDLLELLNQHEAVQSIDRMVAQIPK
ncbi:hypothetical protein B566_EDAN012804 [Ephemera danica]|nr:hypothetical protein B566_EDAN012804 [Ephemera danica]